jgi:hypothetical protein
MHAELGRRGRGARAGGELERQVAHLLTALSAPGAEPAPELVTVAPGVEVPPVLAGAVVGSQVGAAVGAAAGGTVAASLISGRAAPVAETAAPVAETASAGRSA